jgi:ABC-2 type transport system permease protein
MNIKRIGILLKKEFLQGASGFLLLFAFIVPVVLTLVVNLLFGNLFSGKPKLGITDAGVSRFTIRAKEMDSFIVKTYPDQQELKEAAELGAVDIGVALPDDFDTRVSQNERTALTAYVWGESLMKNRVMLIAGMATWIREIAGQESPVEILTTTLGEVETLSWEERLMPFIVVMAVMIGGVMLPSTSLVDEKHKRTLRALTVSPATVIDVFAAKALLGITVSTFSGILILLLNGSFGVNPYLLLFLLVLGSVMAAEIGVLLGAYMKDINSLFATIKTMGIVLYAPAIIYMFPAIPQWLGYFFPTYYMIRPVIAVTQEGARWSEIAWMVYLQAVLIVLLGLGIVLVARGMRKRES